MRFSAARRRRWRIPRRETRSAAHTAAARAAHRNGANPNAGRVNHAAAAAAAIRGMVTAAGLSLIRRALTAAAAAMANRPAAATRHGTAISMASCWRRNSHRAPPPHRAPTSAYSAAVSSHRAAR